MTFDKGSIQSPGRSIRGAHPRWHGSMVGVRGMLQTARSGRRRVFSPHPVDARKRSNVFLKQTSTRVHGLLVPTRSTRHGSRTHCHWTVQILSFLLAMKLCTTSTSCLVAGRHVCDTACSFAAPRPLGQHYLGSTEPLEDPSLTRDFANGTINRLSDEISRRNNIHLNLANMYLIPSKPCLAPPPPSQPILHKTRRWRQAGDVDRFLEATEGRTSPTSPGERLEPPCPWQILSRRFDWN